ncbi:uncharacterized protein VP01_3361g1 [Puccinia sorghi]|uniref:3-oxoacyl-[acyl-carrier protein] reductase n=1 Tax=Puccinia sorghi TaxID=27349 RepID=A0A0L6UX07_9BASI|nr:uncharacterized protein VP01_3361g1 [Puccinia sorghi]
MSSNSLKIESLFGLQGRVAVITGGSKGLGQSCVLQRLIHPFGACMDSERGTCSHHFADGAELNECGPGKAEYIVGDLSSKAGCVAVCAEIKKRFQKIHVLVNNAGAILSAPYDDVPEKGEKIFTSVIPSSCAACEPPWLIIHMTVIFTEGWDDVFDLNAKAVFYMTSELTQELSKDATNLDPGRVVVMSSAAAFNFNTQPLQAFGIKGKGNWSYKASKAAALSLSTNLAVTLAPKFITVNAICPGFFRSSMTQSLFDSIGDSIDKEHPMGRSGTPEDIAGVFLFLTSRAGAHVSGNVSIFSNSTQAMLDQSWFRLSLLSKFSAFDPLVVDMMMTTLIPAAYLIGWRCYCGWKIYMNNSG